MVVAGGGGEGGRGGGIFAFCSLLYPQFPEQCVACMRSMLSKYPLEDQWRQLVLIPSQVLGIPETLSPDWAHNVGHKHFLSTCCMHGSAQPRPHPSSTSYRGRAPEEGDRHGDLAGGREKRGGQRGLGWQEAQLSVYRFRKHSITS